MNSTANGSVKHLEVSGDFEDVYNRLVNLEILVIIRKYMLWVLATILYMFVVSTECKTYRLL